MEEKRIKIFIILYSLSFFYFIILLIKKKNLFLYPMNLYMHKNNDFYAIL